MAIDYGTDLDCVTDIASDGRTVTGRMVVAQAIARRWSTPRGRLIGDPNYGFDLTQFLNADMSPRDLAAMRAGAEAEALKDERVERCDVTASIDSDGVMTIIGSLSDADGPFELTVSVSSVSLQLLSVT